MTALLPTLHDPSDRPALRAGEHALSHAELAAVATALAGRIAGARRVAVHAVPGVHAAVAVAAAVLAGVPAVPLNPKLGERELGHVLGDAAPDLVLTAPGAEFPADLPRVDVDLDARGGSVPPDAGPTAPVLVIYTSGTTGPPKGCMLGHDYWLRFVELYGRLYAMGPGDRLLCCLQFFYGDSPWLFLVSLHAGEPLVAMRRFSVSRFWDVVRAFDVTRLFGLASIPSLLLKAPPSPGDRDHGVTMALQVGVPTRVHRELADRWGFPWVEAYGLTETGLVVAMPLDQAEAMTGSGSIGVPCPGADVRLIDEDGSDVAPGEPGEIIVRAPGLMREYLGRPDATAATLRDGWLHTGDVGRADERGYLYFLGRRKDIIRRSGENVAATEVEDVLRAHPAVNEAAVVPVPDDLRGEEIKAWIELVDGRSSAEVPPTELVAFCSERLARHKVPRYVQYTEMPFPRTPSMRVLKKQLSATADGAWDRENGT